jgi:hypothetical protein
LNDGLPDVDLKDFDYVLMLDVVEHLLSPEAFVDELRAKTGHAQHTQLVISTGNIGFFIARMMLLFGQFNYGKRGILDLTHTRLFTFSTLRRLFEQAGFEVVLSRGLPAPFPLAFGENVLARVALGVNQFLIRLWKAAFSYQIYMVARPRPSLETLLEHAYEKSAVREEQTSIE